MSKHTIFISHIAEERQLANIIKENIQKDFLGLIEVFVSSDNESISVGEKWLHTIEKNLECTEVMLIICSKKSVKRPWINFEAGAGWIRNIPVIPICHTDITPINLPIPLNMLQAIEAGTVCGIQKLYQVLAKTIHAETPPRPQLEIFIEEIKKFESHYGLMSSVGASIVTLRREFPSFLDAFLENSNEKILTGQVPESVFEKIKPHLENLESKQLIDFGIGNNVMVFGPGGGNRIQVNIRVKEAFKPMVEQIMKHAAHFSAA